LNKGLTLHLANSESNKCYVKSDRQRLKQVLLNLVTNAVKYNIADGSVLIETAIIPGQTTETEQVRISVSDTGVGIAPGDIPKLFTPFERIGAEKSATEGTGLGLAVVKKLVDAMGGRVGVESTHGKGSTFWIEMPLCKSQLESAEKSGILSEIRPEKEVGTGNVLYIEDNASNVELVDQILSTMHSGINLVTSMYGRDTVPIARNSNPDLILLDLNLPDIHGSEVLRLLQEEEQTRNIPVVVISADAMPKTIELLLKKGARKFLTKPLDVMELLKVIEEFVVKKSE
jgi:CheY-like chemotaxis protein/anti-sigma regulatory factor (Ser/Thr protein kinase)